MSSKKGFGKRLGFKRTNTNQNPVILTELSATDSNGEQAASSNTITGHGDATPVIDEVVSDISEAEASRRLAAFRRDHRWDPNMPDDAIESVDAVTGAHDHKGEAQLVGDVIENSPYPEVRAVVLNYDQDVPASTIRAWVIGLLMTTICSGVNALFLLRYPIISIGPYVVLLLAYPIGLATAKVLPNKEFKIFGQTANLNPGPFNVKEHVIIVTMANAAFGGGGGYFIDTVVSLKKFYHFDTSEFGWGFSILFALSTQCLGFGLAGSVRKFLVEPAAMIWPGALVNVGFLYTLHDHQASDPAKTNGWSISRYKWFMVVMAGMFVWSWFPDFIIPAFSYFAWVTWIKPDNVIVNQLFGQTTGISLGFPFTGFTLDWAQINSFYGSPLISPWHAHANTALGIVFFVWIVIPAVNYSGAWYGDYVPISQNSILDNTGANYNVSRILTPEHTVDPAAYEAYSPLFLSTANAFTYGLNFASIAAIVSHTYLFHGSEIWRRWKSTSSELDDVHMKIMRKYRLAPTWWYLALLAVMTAFAFASALAYPTNMAWYSVVLSLVIAATWTIPIGIIQAFTNIQLGLNVFTEFIIGYVQPGHPIAMMMFKTFGYIIMTQALYFCQDLKLGHYMHVPQRSLFAAQLVATVWSCLCQLATVEWAMGAIKNVCTSAAAGSFNCAYIKTFYSASVLWGAIGPKHLFSGDAVYTGLQYFWLAGFIAPFLVYGLARMFPKISMIRKISMPIMFACMAYVPPYSPMNMLSWVAVGYIFNKFIRDKYRGWWMQYNYITSAALDIGLALCAIVLFFCVLLPGAEMPAYWGTTIVGKTLDGAGTAVRKTVAEGEIFGPKTWKW
ncbi:small oligopeptide transporter-like protein [Ophiobolus disseminans]|uniref:Small oligopeptide transporter-like protein n=1 Tax=Ophiobolus disseminans TaxID=1469910 RepID=A0A6A7AGP5_9PLEO|nr:small oligopeptide transporter-like protein [Ophiobolus disseminans]